MPMIRRSAILLSLLVFHSTLLSAAEGPKLQKLVIGCAAGRRIFGNYRRGLEKIVR
jgi:hypothetical protein